MIFLFVYKYRLNFSDKMGLLIIRGRDLAAAQALFKTETKGLGQIIGLDTRRLADDSNQVLFKNEI